MFDERDIHIGDEKIRLDVICMNEARLDTRIKYAMNVEEVQTFQCTSLYMKIHPAH